MNLESLVTELDRDSSSIKKEEARINSKNLKDISTLNAKVHQKQSLTDSLYTIRDKVKDNIEKFENDSRICQETYESIEEKSKSLFDIDLVAKTRIKLNDLKKETHKID